LDPLRKIKNIRKKKRITLRQMADQTGLSVNYLSQVERGLANPSVAVLKKIFDVLDMPFMSLVEDNPSQDPSNLEEEPAKVVTADRRKTLIYPGGARRAELLTPNLRGRLEVLLCNEDPEPPEAVDWYSHEGEEFGLVLEGVYEVAIEGRVYLLHEGDSITFSSSRRHKLRNPGRKPARLLWVITPPSF